METIYQKNAKVFKALCDEKRLAILEQLRSGEKCACILLEQLDLTQSGLSYHMKILCESGIVSSRQEGKWVKRGRQRLCSRFVEEADHARYRAEERLHLSGKLSAIFIGWRL